MTGKTLKERIGQLSYLNYNEIAKRLNVSEQSMYQYFLVNDVKSGLIEKIAEIIGVDINTMYGIEPSQNINNNQGDVITGDNVSNRNNDICTQVISVLDNQLKVKDEQIRVRDEQIGKLINIINK